MSNIDFEKLRALGACDDAMKWLKDGGYTDFATAWDACQRPDWMLWLHDSSIITISDRDLRLFACDCVRYTPIGDGRTVLDLIGDEHSRNAVEVAERYANGEATQDDLYAARDAAWHAAMDVAMAAARAAARDVAWYATMDVAMAAARGAARDVAWYATMDVAMAFQADLLRKRVGNPFRETQP